MTDFVKTVSHLVEDQFPDIYKEEGSELIEFTKAYYEYLESDENSFINRGKSLPSINDVDETLAEFVEHYKKKYLADFPFIDSTDSRFMIKHIMDYYRSKGTTQGLKLLIQMLYGQEAKVYLPSVDILSPSSSEWFVPNYIEVSTGPRNKSFLNKDVFGATSGAKATVEGIVTKRISGKFIDVMYLSDIKGRFENGEYIVTSDGNLKNAPQVIGSLSDVKVTLGGRDNTIGDIFDVLSDNGKQGKVKVTSIENATGRVDFKIMDGGTGYTKTDTTDVYISDTVLNLDNANEEFIEFETVQQPIETISTLSSSDINSSWTVGDYVVGYDGSNVAVATGVVVEIANTDSDGLVIQSPSANSNIKVLVSNGTFGQQLLINTVTATDIVADEFVEEESTIDLDITNLTGNFTVGEEVRQTLEDTINGKTYTTHRAEGIVVSANSSVVTVDKAFGTFLTNISMAGQDSSAAATVVSVSITDTGARGRVTDVVDADTLLVEDVYGAFTVGKMVRGTRTLKQNEVASVASTGASDVRLNDDMSANGIVDVVANNYVVATVVGQNTSAVGLHGNTAPFIDTDGAFIETKRENLISPPRNANNEIIEVIKDISAISTGADANFKIGSLENEETIFLNTDILGANNYANVAFEHICLNGANSGIGFVDSVSINDGGTLYANGTIVEFRNGGYASGNPINDAVGVITTDVAGAITDITITNPGQGYFSDPDIILPATSGTTANVTPNMDYGYGFRKLPDGDESTFIGDLLTNENFTIGTIASLTSINPGTNYNVNPFVNIYNPYIATYNRGDFLIRISNLQGSFRPGEIVSQDVGNETFAKGKVQTANTTAISIARTSFNISFSTGYTLNGEESGSTAMVDQVIGLENDSNIMGHNGEVNGKVISANGISTSLEVIDSGFGYIEGETLQLSSANSVYIMEGLADVSKHGIGEGYWRTIKSHLSSSNHLHDGHYYQNFSYDVITGNSLNRYEAILKKIMHVAGTKMFGSVMKVSVMESKPTVAESSINIS